LEAAFVFVQEGDRYGAGVGVPPVEPGRLPNASAAAWPPTGATGRALHDVVAARQRLTLADDRHPDLTRARLGIDGTDPPFLV
jgi:hypothetical protein